MIREKSAFVLYKILYIFIDKFYIADIITPIPSR